jgi:hypothetical protein
VCVCVCVFFVVSSGSSSFHVVIILRFGLVWFFLVSRSEGELKLFERISKLKAKYTSWFVTSLLGYVF